jgi:hypothetical protein
MRKLEVQNIGKSLTGTMLNNENGKETYGKTQRRSQHDAKPQQVGMKIGKTFGGGGVNVGQESQSVRRNADPRGIHEARAALVPIQEVVPSMLCVQNLFTHTHQILAGDGIHKN